MPVGWQKSWSQWIHNHCGLHPFRLHHLLCHQRKYHEHHSIKKIFVKISFHRLDLPETYHTDNIASCDGFPPRFSHGLEGGVPGDEGGEGMGLLVRADRHRVRDDLRCLLLRDGAHRRQRDLYLNIAQLKSERKISS